MPVHIVYAPCTRSGGAPAVAEGGLGQALFGKGSGCKNGPYRIDSEFILNKNDELICWMMTLIFTGPWQD